MPLIQIEPLYDGVNIFGPAPAFKPNVEPVRDQRTCYPGVNGTERIVHGTVGSKIEVTGILVGDDVYDLASQELTWFQLQALSPIATLQDDNGNLWLNCFLEIYQPAEETKPWIGETGVSRVYHAIFRTLS